MCYYSAKQPSLPFDSNPVPYRLACDLIGNLHPSINSFILTHQTSGLCPLSQPTSDLPLARSTPDPSYAPASCSAYQRRRPKSRRHRNPARRKGAGAGSLDYPPQPPVPYDFFFLILSLLPSSTLRQQPRYLRRHLWAPGLMMMGIFFSGPAVARPSLAGLPPSHAPNHLPTPFRA